MTLSRCCKVPVWVYCGNEGTSFYVCERCDRACDTIAPKEFNHNMEVIDAEV